MIFEVPDMEEVMGELQKGLLDQNPRLCRRIICSKCGNRARRFIDYLREGRYEVGKTEKITVAEPGQYVLFKYEEEAATPILIKTVCEKCGHQDVVSDPILTVEYLTAICKCRKPSITYV